MILATSFAAWLVFGTAAPSDASQTVRAIPFASFEFCERRMEAEFGGLLSAEAERGANHRQITIKPYCTTLAPSFWVAPKEAF